MSIKTVLFDLDGTLLPMDMDAFTTGYFKLLAKKVAPLGYEPQKLVKSIWAGTAAMVKNDGSCTNEDAFWKLFASLYPGQDVLKDKPVFDEFYRIEFQGAQAVCGFDPVAAETVNKIKEAGYRVTLATNPLFPHVATESRIRWAGLEPEDFEDYTTYENCHYCKPNPQYYVEVLERLGLKAEECLMVGNDVDEDMIAETLGMKVFLLTDCLINKHDKDISAYPHGNFADLQKWLLGE
ncbi:MAG: HAD family hydrolase [Lachnospiraceae bacterium]|nr:HAD family hydrolase [Candidatus Equihabitans merdae]